MATYTLVAKYTKTKNVLFQIIDTTYCNRLWVDDTRQTRRTYLKMFMQTHIYCIRWSTALYCIGNITSVLTLSVIAFCYLGLSVFNLFQLPNLMLRTSVYITLSLPLQTAQRSHEMICTFQPLAGHTSKSFYCTLYKASICTIYTNSSKQRS